VNDKFGVVLTIHAIVGKLEKTNLPKQESKGVDIGGKVIGFTPSDFGRHVSKRASVSGEFVKLGAPVLHGGI